MSEAIGTYIDRLPPFTFMLESIKDFSFSRKLLAQTSLTRHVDKKKVMEKSVVVTLENWTIILL